VLLFEAPEVQVAQDSATRLLPLTWEHLVEASIGNADDAPTLSYLMRCAARLKESRTSGFLLQDEDGRPVHFVWVDNYDGFRFSELYYNLEPSSPSAAILFDSWTPAAHRGRGHYSITISQAAANLRREGRTVWGFSAAANVSSLKGILKAGFEYRFSLVRERRFGRALVTRHDTTKAISLPLPASRVA
jgi:hypothetical protein